MPNEKKPKRRRDRPPGAQYTIGPSRRLRIGKIVIRAEKRAEIYIDGIRLREIAIENTAAKKLEFAPDPAQ